MIFSMSNWSEIQWFFHDFFIFTNFKNLSWNSMIFPWSWNRSEFQWFFKSCGNPESYMLHIIKHSLTFVVQCLESRTIQATKGFDPGHLNLMGTLLLTWISNHRPNKMWDEIPYPFPNFNDCTVEVWEWISNFIPHFIMDVINYPCLRYHPDTLSCSQVSATNLKLGHP